MLRKLSRYPIAAIGVALLLAAAGKTIPAQDRHSLRLARAESGAVTNSTPHEAPVTVLLVTSNELAPAWKDFVHWKTRLGKRTKVVTTGQIEKQYEGDDVQQKIRACCLEHIQRHGTRWVILGGDSQPNGAGHVPDRDTVHNSNFARYADIPTDVYYTSEKDWDANDDGVYGDWKQDRQAIAYTNERASIGRIPVRTTDDVAAYTEKIIAYEKNYPATEFAGGLVYTCPVAGAYPKLNTSKDVLESNWDRGDIAQFFASKTPWDNEQPGDHGLTPENWVNLINDRRTGKMHMHGHGFLPVWILESNSKVSARQVEQLKNEDAYLTMTTVSCFTGHFDARQDPSITESMLRRPRAGAVLIVAPARVGVPAFHDPRRDLRLMVTEGKMDGTTETMTQFWRHALAENLTAGEAFRAAKAGFADDARKTPVYHFIQCELNLLGDPTLDLRAKAPVTPKLEVPESVATGTQQIRVATGTAGATVCLWKDDDAYHVTTTDEQGVAVASVAPKTSGPILVTVSGANLNAATAKIEVR